MEKGYLSQNIFADIAVYVIALSAIIAVISSSDIVGSKRNRTFSKVKWQRIWLVYIAYIFFSVNRKIGMGYGGTDANGYLLDFEAARLKNLYEWLCYRNVELGYVIIEWFISVLFKNFKVMLFVFHSICYWSLIRFCSYLYLKKYKMLLLFVLFFNLLDVNNTLRNTAAVCLFLNVLVDLNDKRYVRAVLTALFTISIHISALIILPVIVVNIMFDLKNKSLKKRYFIMLILGEILAFVAVPLVIKIAESSGKYYVYGKSGVAYPVYCVTLFVFMVSAKKIRQLGKYSRFNPTLVVTLPICLFVMPLQMQYGVLYRMTLYFMPVMMGLFSSIITEYKSNSLKACLVKSILIGYLIVRIYKLITVNIYDVGLPYVLDL